MVGNTIWCFTDDPEMRWDYCYPIHEEQEMPEPTFYSPETLTGLDWDMNYRGSQHYTRSGILCQNWNSQYP